MCKYRRILVGLDGSDASRHALEEALKFAKETQAEVIAISVIPVLKGLASALSIFGNIKENLKKTHVKALEEAEDLAEDFGMKIKTILEEGKPCEKIIEAIGKFDCDLVITGRRGATSFDKILIGSTAARVLNESPVDMIIVPRKSSLRIKKILAATDGSVVGNNAVKKAGKVAKAYDAELDIISVVQLPPESVIEIEEIMDILKNELQKELEPIIEEIRNLGLQPQVFIEKGDPHAVIVNKINTLGSTILAIGADEETGRKIIGSAAQKIIANSPVPILIIKKP